MGTLNRYTSCWLRSDSGALKKCAETSGPMKKEMFLFNSFKVNTLPSFGYSSLSMTTGPFKNRMSPPINGNAFIVGGSRFLDLGIISADISLATTKVATRRKAALKNLLSTSIDRMLL